VIGVAEWRKLGGDLGTRDGRVFVTTRGEGEDVLLLHGFPTSSWDFAGLASGIARQRRAIAFDFLGYGLSEKPASYGYSLFEQADVAIAVARHFGVCRAHLLAHDMGTSVATELLARRERGQLPFEVASLVLTNGSVHVELAHLTVGQRILRSPLGPLFVRLNNRRSFEAQLRRTFAHQPSNEEVSAMWELLSREDGAQRLPQLIGYVTERARFRRRWIGALERLDVPTLVAWGERDPIAVMDIARALAAEIPGAEFESWPDVGHWPQLEATDRLLARTERFWDRIRSST
jgi:pimeloyl-ACP methyl ester carboxylesterase